VSVAKRYPPDISDLNKASLAKAKFAQAKELDANVVFGEELTNEFKD
jgi:hypothetical protein